MPRRLHGILLGLALAAAPAYAQTTTTTGSTPTTSTTIVGVECARNPTLCRVNSRLEALRDTVFDAGLSGSLGRRFFPISFRLQASSRCLSRAHGLCNGRVDIDESRARAKLQQCVRPLVVVLAKIRSRYGRRVIPPDLAAMLASEVDGVANDLRAARESLTCP